MKDEMSHLTVTMNYESYICHIHARECVWVCVCARGSVGVCACECVCVRERD